MTQVMYGPLFIVASVEHVPHLCVPFLAVKVFMVRGRDAASLQFQNEVAHDGFSGGMVELVAKARQMPRTASLIALPGFVC
jgi:hypothetical protein